MKKKDKINVDHINDLKISVVYSSHYLLFLPVIVHVLSPCFFINVVTD